MSNQNTILLEKDKAGQPLHSYTDYLKISQIKEDTNVSTSEKTVSGTIEGLQILLSKEREILTSADESGDEGTIDLLSGYTSEQKKLTWMLSAYNK